MRLAETDGEAVPVQGQGTLLGADLQAGAFQCPKEVAAAPSIECTDNVGSVPSVPNLVSGSGSANVKKGLKLCVGCQCTEASLERTLDQLSRRSRTKLELWGDASKRLAEEESKVAGGVTLVDRDGGVEGFS